MVRRLVASSSNAPGLPLLILPLLHILFQFHSIGAAKYGPRQTQVFPLDVVDDGRDGDDRFEDGWDRWADSEEEEEEEGDYGRSLKRLFGDEEGRGRGGGGGGRRRKNKWDREEEDENEDFDDRRGWEDDEFGEDQWEEGRRDEEDSLEKQENYEEEEEDNDGLLPAIIGPRSEHHGAGTGRGPSAAFWQNAIGPFMFTFENGDRRKAGQLWTRALDRLNRMRRERLGLSFRDMEWDDRLADSLRRVNFSRVAPLPVPMRRAENGIAGNLVSGMETLFQAVLLRHIRCEKKAGICRAKRSRQHRIPTELVDSRARRLGCVAQLFKKESGSRRLQFTAICRTERSSRQESGRRAGTDSNNRELFRLDQVKNGRLRRKLTLESERKEEEEEEWDKEEDSGSSEKEEGRRKGGRKAAETSWNGQQMRAESGDLLEAKVEAIVNPTGASLTTGPSTGEEAVKQVLAAKSVLDVLNASRDDQGGLNQKRTRRALRRLGKLVDPDNAVADRERAKAAKRKVEQWRKQVEDETGFQRLQREANKQRKGRQEEEDSNDIGSISQRIIEAGGPGLERRLSELARGRGGLAVGDAVATDSFNIKYKQSARAIIHTVPPSELQTQRDKDKLAECYRRVLDQAVQLGVRTIAFPAIRPENAKDEKSRLEAARIGVEAVAKWMRKNGQQQQGQGGNGSGRTTTPSSKVKVLFRLGNDSKLVSLYKQLIQQQQQNGSSKGNEAKEKEKRD